VKKSQMPGARCILDLVDAIVQSKGFSFSLCP
jgi:hypothetical protein